MWLKQYPASIPWSEPFYYLPLTDVPLHLVFCMQHMPSNQYATISAISPDLFLGVITFLLETQTYKLIF